MTSLATWIETFTGKKIDILSPDPNEVDLLDIAHALSNTNRFGGHARVPYSVAEHCVRMVAIVPNHLRMEALLHDAAEAYTGDMPSPFKQVMDEFRRYESLMERAVRSHFGLPGDRIPGELKLYDNIMLITEARDLGFSWWNTNKHSDMPDPLEEEIVPWDWRTARDAYINTYYDLKS